MNSMLYLASAEAAADDGGIFGSLGIDWRLLVVQTIAFMVLLWVLSKFVYPVLASMLDKREATIREGIEAAEKAEQRAAEANAEIEALLNNARKQAKAVVASAKDEAASIAESANAEATKQTERMLKKASDEIEREIENARKALRDETVGLVSLATEKVVGSVVTGEIDKKVISKAIEEAK